MPCKKDFNDVIFTPEITCRDGSCSFLFHEESICTVALALVVNKNPLKKANGVNRIGPYLQRKSDRASRTFSGVIGRSLILTPMAS